MKNVKVDRTPAKQQKMLKKFKNSSMMTVAKQSMSSQSPMGSVMELPGDLNRKSEHTLHFSFITITCSPTHV
jgi:hypothetical protein